MPVVQMPDGTTVEFPDSMSQTDIEKVLQQQSKPATTSAASTPASPASPAQKFNQGLFSILGVPGALNQLGQKYVTNPLRGAVGLPPNNDYTNPAPLLGGILPNVTPQMVNSTTDYLGLTNTAAPPDPNPTHRYINAALQGVGAAVPAALTMQPELMLGTGATGASSGIGAQAGQDLFPNSSVAPLVGGLLGGGLGGAAVGTAIRAANALTGDLTGTGQAYQAAGVPIRAPGLVSENPLTQAGLGPAANLPLAESDLRISLMSSADKLGVSANMQEAGQYAQNAARNWITQTMPVKEAAAWASVDAKIPAGTPTQLYGLAGALKDIQGDAGIIQALRNEIVPRLPARLQSTMNAVLDNPAGVAARPPELGTSPLLGPTGLPIIKEIKPGTPAQPVTWSDVRSLRSALGDAMSNPSVVNDIGAQNLKHLYASITGDLSATAKAQNALPEFAAANAESTRLNSFKDGTLGQIVKGKTKDSSDPIPEKAASILLSPGKLQQGGSVLESLNTELPDVTSELASARIREMAGMKNPDIPSDTVAKGFVRAWSALSPQAKDALVLDLPTRARLDGAYQVAQRVAGTKPSTGGVGLGHVAAPFVGLEAGREIGGLVGHAMGMASNSLVPGEAGSLVGALAGAVLPSAGRLVRNRLSNSPWLAQLAAGQSPSLLPGQTPGLSALAASGFVPQSGQQGQR